jgi:hypothetical protein
MPVLRFWREVMAVSRRLALSVAAAIGIAMAMFVARNTPAPAADIVLAPGISHGVNRYVDRNYQFSFWYPRGLTIAVLPSDDDKSFPGGVLVETLQVGDGGEVSVHVVRSPKSTITDEPNGHASPIAQNQYFYDASSQRWMLAYPEGNGEDDPHPAPKPADVSKTTIGGQPMLPSNARFDTTIIPLSTTLFVVVQDGGGSAFTDQIAATVAPLDAHVEPAALKAALRDLAVAYEKQLGRTISPSTLCALSGTCGR